MGVEKAATKTKQKKKGKKWTDLFALLDSVFIMVENEERARDFAEAVEEELEKILNTGKEEKQFVIRVLYSQKSEILWEVTILVRLFGDPEDEESLLQAAKKLIDLNLDWIYKECSKTTMGTDAFYSNGVKDVISRKLDASNLLDMFAREMENETQSKINVIKKLLLGIETISAKVAATLSKTFTLSKEDATTILFHDVEIFLRKLNDHYEKRVFLSKTGRLRPILVQAVELSDKDLTVVEESLGSGPDSISILDISKVRKAGENILFVMQELAVTSIIIDSIKEFVSLQMDRMYDITSLARLHLYEVDDGTCDVKEIISDMKKFIIEIDEREALVRQMVGKTRLRWVDQRNALYRSLQRNSVPKIYFDLFNRIDDGIREIQEFKKEFHETIEWAKGKVKEYFELILENKERIEKIHLIKKGYRIYDKDIEVGGEIGAELGIFHPKLSIKYKSEQLGIHPDDENKGS